MGIRHEWARGSDGWHIRPILNSAANRRKFTNLVRSSQTHQSFINLINNQADIILSARSMSPDERAYADSAGVSLIETPIALDSLVFIVHPSNPIETLTIEQIQNIYTENITNWNEVDGNDAKINPYIRNPNSGSQELMESLVMQDMGTSDFPWSSELTISGMVPVFEMVSTDRNAICYSVFYFREHIIRSHQSTKMIAINDIFPDNETISNRSYPLITGVYVVIRSDIDKSSMAYKLYNFLQTELGKEVIRESGYIPN
jgi:phosphate transport system substrate-binding protein